MVLLANAPAQAEQPSLSVFMTCDGFGAPSRSGDGMTMQANTLGIFAPDPGYGTTVQRKINLREYAIGACDKALASPLLLPGYWQRRVSLLRAKAFHLLATGKPDEARAELARARAAVTAADPYFDRTMGLGFDFLLAWMQRDADQAAASRLAIETWRKRPYNNETVASALVAMGPKASQADIETVLGAGAAVYPHLIPILYQYAYEQGRFAQAADLYGDIRINYAPTNRLPDMYTEGYPGGYDILAERYATEVALANRSGQQAYMLAVLGRDTEAAAVLQAARDRLMILIQPLPKQRLRSNGKPVPEPYRQATREANARLTLDINRLLDQWAGLIGQRGEATANPSAVVAALRTTPPPATRATVDLLDVLLAGNLSPADRAFVVDLQGRARAAITAAAFERDAKRTTLVDLFRGLPEPETAGRLEAYNKPRTVGAKGQFWPVTPGAVVVTYYGFESSLAMVQEQTLLMGAEYARSKGFKGFIVLDRKDVQQGASSSPYGGVNNMHIGYSSYLLILPVDPAALPQGYTQSGWRVLDAETVYNALYPLYGPGARKKK